MTENKAKTILVVEDNYLSYKLIEAHFRRTPYGIKHASDGQTAVDIFRENQDIVLVLMDIQLPRISGLDATVAIHEINPDVPVIATTANAFDSDRAMCLEAGCCDYISKPIHFPTLFSMIEKYTRE